MRLVVRVAGLKKGGALKYKTRTQQYLGTRIPGTWYIVLESWDSTKSPSEAQTTSFHWP